MFTDKKNGRYPTEFGTVVVSYLKPPPSKARSKSFKYAAANALYGWVTPVMGDLNGRQLPGNSTLPADNDHLWFDLLILI